MNRLNFKPITIFIVLTVFVILIAGFFIIPFRSNKAVQVFFLSYTNDAVQGKLAVFSVTNVSDFRLVFLPCSPQTKNYESWSAVKYRYATGMTELLPHEHDVFVTSFPTNGEPWRVPVQWSYSPPNPIEGFRGYLESLSMHNWDRLKKGKWPKYYNRATSGILGNEYTAFSAELTNNPVK